MATLLNKRERRYVEAFADQYFPPGGPFPEGPFHLKLTEKIDQMIQKLEYRNQWIVFLLIYAFEFSSFFSRFLTPFSMLSRKERQKYLTGCQRNPLRRSLLQGLRAFYGTAYFSQKKVLKAISFDSQPYKAAGVLPPLPSQKLSHPGPSKQKKHREEWADIAIVGSGAGGATVALELAREGLDIALVEEGEEVTREDFPDSSSPEFFPFYRQNCFTATLGIPVIVLPMGKVVGGTTVINSGTCFRTPDFVLEKWGRERGIEKVESSLMEPLYKEIEERLHVRSVTDDLLGGNGQILRRGADALGVHHSPIQRPMEGCIGQGQCVLGCPQDGKMDMRLSYLPEAQKKGARIYSQSRVEEFLWKGSQVVGLKAVLLDDQGKKTGETLTLKARAVVLSAGAIYTPWLLLRNSIRGKWVGRNLHIHPAYVTAALFEEDIYGWKGVMQSYYVDQWIQEGIMLEATFPPPKVGYGSGILPYTGMEHKELIYRYKNLAEVGILISDSTTGRVRVGLDGNPWIFYSLNKEDVAKVLKGIDSAARILFAAGAKEVYTGLPGARSLSSPRDLAKILSRNWKAWDLTLGAFHPLGTCRMGRNPQEGVTDSYGSVYGISGLFIADASLIPTSIHVNPQITIMALAMRVARKILDQGRKTP